MRMLVEYKSGVVAPDGYQETLSEYVTLCNICEKECEDRGDAYPDICADCEADIHRYKRRHEFDTWHNWLRSLLGFLRRWICKECEMCSNYLWLTSKWSCKPGKCNQQSIEPPF